MLHYNLQKAAELIEQTAKQLDTSETPACPHCGDKKKINIEEYRISEELISMAKKLRKLFTRLEGNHGTES